MPLTGKLILVVDDDTHLTHFIGVTLRNAGANVMAANSLKEALAQIGFFTYDAVITDINLLDGTGYELLSEIRKNSIPTPVIATSGALDVYMAFIDGFDYKLEKPFQPQDLIDALVGMTRIPVAN